MVARIKAVKTAVQLFRRRSRGRAEEPIAILQTTTIRPLSKLSSLQCPVAMVPSASMESESMEDVFLQDELGPSIAEHALQCSHLFRKQIAIPKVAPDPILLDDQLARFTLWTSNMDVFGPPNVSLDYRLRYSPTIVEIIHQLLSVICDSLISLKPTDDSLRPPKRKKRRRLETDRTQVIRSISNESDSESSDESSYEDQEQENISLIAHTIGGTVTRLFRLSNAIRKSAKTSRAYKIGEYTNDEEANKAINELRLFTDSYIRFRFPQAPDALRSALVDANAVRLRRLYYQRSHRRRIALSVKHPQTDPSKVQLPKIPDQAPVVRFTSTFSSKPRAAHSILASNDVPPAPVTCATTARQTAVGALYADSRVEIPRAKSVLVNNKLSFPPVPTNSECPYCGVIVEFKDATKTITWNDHVIRDLEPFVCIFAQCMDSSQDEHGSLTFETSKAWLNHLQTAHGYAWECRAPSHGPIIFQQEIDFQEHSRREHGVPEAHVGTLSGAARRPIIQKILECPFGDECPAPINAQSTTIFSSEALHSHITAHMKEIALLALQKLPGDDDDNLEDIGSDALSEDGGMAKLRGSMYSVLDDEALEFLDEAEDGVADTIEEGVHSVERLDLEDKDATGMTKLHRAVRDNELFLVQSLINQGANLQRKAGAGLTVLHYASLNKKDSTAMIRLLLNSEAKKTINFRDSNGQSALHFAARTDFVEAIQLLVDYGASTDIHDNYGFSPYLWAIVARSRHSIGLFHSLGAHNFSVELDGRPALAWALNMADFSIFELLESRLKLSSLPSSEQDLMLKEAAVCGYFGITHLLLDKSISPNYRDRDGWSALHWAAEEGHGHVVSLLLDYGADVDAVSLYGTSPLHCAANGGHASIARELLHHGADPLRKTCHGWTPLHHAAFAGDVSVVRCLLSCESKEQSFYQDNHGWSIFHLAALGRHLDIIQILSESSVNLGSRLQSDDSGLTAGEWLDLEFHSHSYKTNSNLAFSKSRCCRAVTGLRKAAQDGNIALTHLLIEKEHQINHSNSGRRTALYHAARRGHTPVLRMLLDNGADPNILPLGRRAWEDFISDDAILHPLRRAGYKKPTPDPALDDEIRSALAMPKEISSEDQPTQRILGATTYILNRPVRKVEGSPSRISKILKRLRG